MQEVLHRYEPQAVLLVGIAAGLKHKVRIGDVVFSERVVAYESAAEVLSPDGHAHQEPRPEIQRLPHRMQQGVVNYRPDRERLEERFRRAGGAFLEPSRKDKAFYQEHVATRLSVKRATVASGEKLLRNPNKLLEIRKLHGKTEVGEMEAAGLSTQVTQALETFKEEVLRNPTEIDLEVPEGSLEIERLPCFLKNHEEVEAAARALHADVVIWGQAFCNVVPAVTVNQQNTTIVGNVSAQNSDVRIGTTEVVAPKPYTVCPKATLFRYAPEPGHPAHLGTLRPSLPRGRRSAVSRSLCSREFS